MPTTTRPVPIVAPPPRPPRTPRAERPYTARDAAALGVHEDTVRMNWRELGGFRAGRAYRFPRAAIDALAAGVGGPVLPEPAAAPPDGTRALALCLADAVRHLLLRAEAEDGLAGRGPNRDRRVWLGDLQVLADQLAGPPAAEVDDDGEVAPWTA